MEELIRSIAEKAEGPSETVVAMLQARIGRLPPGARRAVRAAAVFGQTFWLGGIAALLELSDHDLEGERWLASLLDAEFIQAHAKSRLPDEKEYSFRHALVQDAAYGLLTASDLTTGHLSAAAFLDTAGEPDTAVIAEHFNRGGDKTSAADYYLCAAAGSRRGIYLASFAEVERGTGWGPAEDVVNLLHGLEYVSALLLNSTWRLITEGQVALQHAREVGDSIRELSLGIILAWGWLDLGDVDSSRQQLFSLEAPMLQSQHFILIAMWRHVLGRTLCDSSEESAWAQAEQVVAPMLENSGERALLSSMAHEILGRVALRRGQAERAEGHARLALQGVLSIMVWLAPAAAVQIRALLAMGRASEAVAVAEQVRAAIPDLDGVGVFELELRIAACDAWYAAGNREAARAELRATLRQIRLCADDITDPFWRNSYKTRNPSYVRAEMLAEELGLAATD